MRSAAGAGTAAALPATCLPSSAAVCSSAEQVEPVVARGAIGAERDVDAGVEQLRDGAQPARELQVRARAVHDVRAGRRQQIDLGGVSAVACTPIKLGVTSPSSASRASGRRPVAATASSTSAAVSCTCMWIGQVELVGEAADVRERRVADGCTARAARTPS